MNPEILGEENETKERRGHDRSHATSVNERTGQLNNSITFILIVTLIYVVTKHIHFIYQVRWCPVPVCTHDYIEELMFSGFTIQTIDTEFRSVSTRSHYFPVNTLYHFCLLKRLNSLLSFQYIFSLFQRKIWKTNRR